MAFLLLVLFISACQNKQNNYDPEFKKLCKDRTPDNWMSMRPMKDGKFASDKSCLGCMSDDGMSHFCSIEEYKEYISDKK